MFARELAIVQVYNESRLEVVDGGRELVVRRVEPGDRGEYVCTFNLKYHPISQHHTVDILGVYTPICFYWKCE